MSAAPSATPVLVIRPTAKFLYMKYFFSAIVLIFGVLIWQNILFAASYNLYIGLIMVAFAIAVDISTAMKHVNLQFNKLTLTGDSLKYEQGMMSKSTRSLNLTSVQDVRVDQGLFARMFGIGTIRLETAGTTGHLLMEDVDNPHEVADKILSAARLYKR